MKTRIGSTIITVLLVLGAAGAAGAASEPVFYETVKQGSTRPTNGWGENFYINLVGDNRSSGVGVAGYSYLEDNDAYEIFYDGTSYVPDVTSNIAALNILNNSCNSFSITLVSSQVLAADSIFKLEFGGDDSFDVAIGAYDDHAVGTYTYVYDFDEKQINAFKFNDFFMTAKFDNLNVNGVIKSFTVGATVPLPASCLLLGAGLLGLLGFRRSQVAKS